jgi:hypothetical protein
MSCGIEGLSVETILPLLYTSLVSFHDFSNHKRVQTHFLFTPSVSLEIFNIKLS